MLGLFSAAHLLRRFSLEPASRIVWQLGAGAFRLDP